MDYMHLVYNTLAYCLSALSSERSLRGGQVCSSSRGGTSWIPSNPYRLHAYTNLNCKPPNVRADGGAGVGVDRRSTGVALSTTLRYDGALSAAAPLTSCTALLIAQLLWRLHV
jgi:hypothetical protein